MSQITFNVQGMTCGGCVKSVTRVLTELKGVQNVQVSLEKANAVIEFDPTLVDAEQLKEAIEDAGFDATVA